MPDTEKRDPQWFRPKLELYECEGHGRFWEVYEGHDGQGYVGCYDRPEDICAAFAGRIALVYGYAAYEAACDVVIAQDPDGFDLSDVKPRPVLVRVRDLAEISAG